MAYTTAEMDAGARLYSQEPDAGEGGLSAAKLCMLADDDLQSYVFPAVVAVREEYGVVVSDQDITANISAYAIDPRAHAGRLRDVLYVSTTGDVRSLGLIDPEHLGSAYSATQTNSEPTDFYLQNGMLHVWPIPSVTQGTLRQKIFARPGRLVPVDECAEVINVAPAAVPGYWQLSFNTPYPEDWGEDNQTVDVIEAIGSFETKAVAATAAWISAGTYYVLTTAFTRDPVIGDWMCLTGTSCVPQVPDLCHPWLRRRTACAILGTRGDRAMMAVEQQKADELEEQILATLKPRVDGEPRHITTPNSPFRAAMRGGRRYGRMP